MEKFGLYDLIEKLNPADNRKNNFAANEKTPKNTDGKNNMRAPETGAPPQYVMNAKMREFIAKHEALSAEVDRAVKKNAQKNSEKASEKTAEKCAPTAKKRGRPPKNDKRE